MTDFELHHFMFFNKNAKIWCDKYQNLQREILVSNFSENELIFDIYLFLCTLETLEKKRLSDIF